MIFSLTVGDISAGRSSSYAFLRVSAFLLIETRLFAKRSMLGAPEVALSIPTSKCTCFLFRVTIAQSITLSIEQAFKRSIRRKLANTYLEVQSNILPTIIKRRNRTTDLMEASRQVFILPLPKDTIEIAVIKEEERI
jgi:hypothetical protein